VAIGGSVAHTVAMPLALLAVAAALHSGLYGQVRIDPATPVCRIDAPCWKPAPGAVVAFARAGRTVARATADGKGFYRVRLRAGTYAVRVERPKAMTKPRAFNVVVPRGRYRLLNISVDVGIR
jgi:hypothetical protein